MAIIRLRGLDTTTGQTLEVADGDTITVLGVGATLTLAATAAGATGNGGDVVINSGGATDGDGGDILITSSNGTGADRNGGALTLTSGNSTGTQNGGSFSIVGGDGGTTGGGAAVDISGGSGGSTSGDGGNITITGGTAPGSGNAGRVIFTSGGTAYGLTASGGPGPALTTTATTIIEAINEIDGLASTPNLASVLAVGNTTSGTDIEVSAADEIRGVDQASSGLALNIRGGDGDAGNGGPLNLAGGASSSGTTGGSVFIRGGDPGSGNSGGSVSIIAANGFGGSAGTILIQSGNGGTNASGGALNITGGTGNNVGLGGAITLTGGNGGTNANGGNVNLTGGTPGASGDAHGAVVITNGFVTENVITPAALGTGDNDDFNPTGLDEAAVIRLTGDGAGTSVLTGVVLQQDGRRIILANVGTDNITLNHEDAASIFTYRFLLPGATNFVLGQNNSVEMFYDTVSNRWRFFIPQ